MITEFPLRIPLRVLTILLAAIAAAAVPAVAVLPQQSGSVDLLSQANIHVSGAEAGARAGYSVAAAGDVNGDGRDDLILGAPLADSNGRTDSGSAYVLFGSASPVDVDLAYVGAAGFRIDGAVAGDKAGWSVAGAGDVNGDGRDDVILGAPLADSNGRTDSGSAYVVFGSTSPADVDLAALGAAQGFRIDGAWQGWQMGQSVGGAGDVNGDGRADVVVGSHLGMNNGQGYAGLVYVVFGSASPVGVDLASLGSAGFRIGGAVGGDQTGYSVAGAGDVNGDGRADVIVGATGADNNGRDSSGSAYVVFGSASPVDVDLGALGSAGFRIDGAVAGDAAGWSVAGAGDLNGDGRDDVILGASQAGNNGRGHSGSAYVVFGSAAPVGVDLAALGSAGIVIDGPHTVALAGWSVAGAGDVNGDGRDDVVVGASSASNNSRNSSGSAYVLLGSASPVDVDLAALGSAGMRIDGAAASDGAGRSVAGAGDLNGDGRADVILGADHADDYGRTSSGSVYVAYGFGDPAVTYGALSGTVGAPVTTLAPTGVARTGPASFAVSPALPAGLSMDPATGVISGTPTLVVAGSTHTVTMTDLAGSVTASVQIDVVAAPTAPAPPAEPTPAAPAPASPRPDTRAPRAKVRVPASLPAGPRVRVRVRCDERCRVVVRAGTGRPTRVVLRRGVWRWVAVSLPHRSRAARRGGVVRVRLVVSDAAGNRTVQTRTLRTRRAARH